MGKLTGTIYINYYTQKLSNLLVFSLAHILRYVKYNPKFFSLSLSPFEMSEISKNIYSSREEREHGE